MAFLEKIAGPPIRKPDFQRVIFLINHADFLFCYLISTVLCEKLNVSEVATPNTLFWMTSDNRGGMYMFEINMLKTFSLKYRNSLCVSDKGLNTLIVH